MGRWVGDGGVYCIANAVQDPAGEGAFVHQALGQRLILINMERLARVQRFHAAAAALASQAVRRREAKVLRNTPSGWRNNRSQLQQARFQSRAGEVGIEYSFQRDGLKLRIDGEEQANAHCQADGPDLIRLSIAGVQRAYTVNRCGDTYYVDSALGASTLVELPRFPIPKEQIAVGSLVAPLPGVVSEVRVKKGDAISAGDVLLVIESMKVYHWISAPVSGHIADVHVAPGQHVNTGAVLAVIEGSV